MRQFEVGVIYTTRSAFDHECIFSYKVIKRTEKMVTFHDLDEDREYRVKVFVDEHDREYAYPNGRYSMCPVVRA